MTETEKGIFDAVLRGHIAFDSQPWPSISSSAKDLVRKMLTQDPKKRITAAQVLGMPKNDLSPSLKSLQLQNIPFLFIVV